MTCAMDTYNLLSAPCLSEAATDFLQSSAMSVENSEELGERIGTLMHSPLYSRQVIGHTMENSMAETVPLRATYTADTLKLIDLQLKRRSTRGFDTLLKLEDLAQVLTSAYFITERFADHSHHLARRSIASGGALYPIDLYYISLHTIGLKTGIYAYNPHFERLETMRILDRQSMKSELTKVFPQEVVGSWNMDMVSGVLVFGAALNRVCCKYGDRGLRFALTDVGAICQNLHLAAAAGEVSVCAIGGYMDRSLDRLMGFQSPYETALLTMFIGKNNG